MKRSRIEINSINNKSAPNPWLAVNLSMLLSGLGLCYANHPGAGIGFMLAQLGLTVIGAWAIFGASGNTTLGLVCILPIIFVYVVSLFETYRGLSGTSILKAQVDLQQQKDPWFAVFLSQLLPGLGHLYLGQLSLSLLLMVFTLLAIALGSINAWFVWLVPVLYGMSCYQVFKNFPRQFRRVRKFLLVMALVIVALRFAIGALPLWVRWFVEPFIVPSTSMVPTLQVGDRILVDKFHPYLVNEEDLARQGDLIVFRAPAAAVRDGGTRKVHFFVKRIIGKAGQTIEIKDQKVYVDGVVLQENYIAEPPNYQWGPKVVPPDFFFVLGDNRNDSFDSHAWGFLPSRNVLGRAYKIYWPPNRVQPL